VLLRYAQAIASEFGWCMVRAEDQPEDRYMPRGKQYWEPKSKRIWYTRTTGIWQPVWMEAVHAVHLEGLRITPDVDRSKADVEVMLGRSQADLRLRATARFEGTVAAQTESACDGRSCAVTLALKDQKLWSPERPQLYDLTLEDPEVLAEPLVFPTRILRRNAGANAGLIAERGNCETDFERGAAAENAGGPHMRGGLRRPERLVHAQAFQRNAVNDRRIADQCNHVAVEFFRLIPAIVDGFHGKGDGDFEFAGRGPIVLYVGGQHELSVGIRFTVRRIPGVVLRIVRVERDLDAL
jgi:hypothetical protein